MKFAYDIPDSFWSLFRSMNRELYMEALLKINEEYEYNNNNILYIHYSCNISHFGVASKVNKKITTILCNRIKVKLINPNLLS